MQKSNSTSNHTSPTNSNTPPVQNTGTDTAGVIAVGNNDDEISNTNVYRVLMIVPMTLVSRYPISNSHSSDNPIEATADAMYDTHTQTDTFSYYRTKG